METAEHPGASSRYPARTVADLRLRDRATVGGVITSRKVVTVGRVTSLLATLDDGTGELGLLFVGRPSIAGLTSGVACVAEGTVQERDEKLVMWNPSYRLLAAPPDRARRAEVATIEPEHPPVSVHIDEGVSSAVSEEDDATSVVEAAGRFRIYLGAAAGVGKTFAMLSEGQRRLSRGTDVVVGFVEHHGRRRTEELMDGLEVVARKVVEHRGVRFEEMDLEAVIRRKPQVALIDELAHTNVPGSGPNEKRWQDILEILDRGIDVITTLNIQHLESIADAVEQITGTKVRERVPDWVVRRADQIELVDSSPEALRRRMLHGNIYPAEQVPRALGHFFQTENLIALRELALRFLADETEEELLEHLRQHQRASLWETAERMMVSVTPAPGTEGLMRRAARIAARVKAELDVVHVLSGDASSSEDRRLLARLQELTVDLGARWHELVSHDIATALIEFARDHQITQIVIGSSTRSRFREVAGGGSTVRRLIREAGAVGIDVHVIARRRELDGDDPTIEDAAS